VISPQSKYAKKLRRLSPERLRLLNKASYERTKAKLYLLYGNECNECGYRDSRAFNLDHKFRPKGKVNTSNFLRGQALYYAILSGKEDWLKYQLLCANCNTIKRIENDESGKEESSVYEDKVEDKLVIL
jgi:hypothetical protein